MIKKLTSILLAFVFIFLLAACGDKPDTGSSAPAGNEQSSVPYSSTDSSEDKPSSEAPSSSAPSSDTASSDTTSSDETPTGPKTPEEIDFDSWEMQLVNKWNTISDAEAPALKSISSTYAWSNDKRFDARAIDAVIALCKAAHKDGAKLYIISAYRTDATQTRLFNNEVNSVKRDYPSLSQEEAEIKAATEVARPGTSEHQLGLAVDFNSVEQSFENTKAFKWLQKNCTDYGFILRYSASKLDITGVIYEPWHYRYVGKENAKKIKKSGLTLEEYVKANG